VTLSSERAAAPSGRGVEPEWWVVAPPATGSFDGVTHFCAELAAAINEIEPARLVSSHAEVTGAAEVRGIFLQHSPPAFVTGDLPRLLSALSRLRARGVPIVTTVHEYWSPATLSPKRAVWRWLCKRALASVAARSSRLVATTPYAARFLAESGIPGAKDAAVIPVGSTIPVVSKAMRERDPRSTPTIAMFGQPGIFDRAVVRAMAQWIEKQSPRPRWIWMGRSAGEMRAWWRDLGAPDVVEIHGGQPSADVAALLSDADLAVALYDDGASTRRSSLASMIAHGLPVVGLDGRFTDDRLRKSGAFLLSPIGDATAFIANLDRVLRDEALRDQMASASSRLDETDLSWPRIARQYLEIAN
jgi:glycosyltransferase involved in cell wall biosynthesis